MSTALFVRNEHLFGYNKLIRLDVRKSVTNDLSQ